MDTCPDLLRCLLESLNSKKVRGVPIANTDMKTQYILMSIALV